MFLIDKYAIKSVEDAIFHLEELKKLATIANDNSIPHIIFNGQDGSGTKTLIKLFLEMIFDKSINKLVDTTYKVVGSGNIVTDVVIKQSNYHIVIEPNNNNFDKYLIQDVVKEYARRKSLGVFETNKPFKVVFINNIDNLSYNAQTSLRRTMEIYSANCRFIIRSRSLSKVIKPLRSRCCCFNVISPTTNDIFKTLVNISCRENIKLSLDQYMYMSTMANRNIKRAIWFLQLFKHGNTFKTGYDITLDKIIDLIFSKQISNLQITRNLLYSILVTNFSGSTIIKDITLKIVNKPVSDKVKKAIIEIAANKEYDIIRGRREIIHLDEFILRCMSSV